MGSLMSQKSRMIAPARTLAYKLLRRIESQRLFSDDAVNSPDMEKMEPRDRRLTTEIVYGTLRWQGALDYILGGQSSRPWPEVDPGARILLRMSLYQWWHMDRIPDHALVNDAVELAKRELGRGMDRYLNGMLRQLGRTRPWQKTDCLLQAAEWEQVSLPEWLWQRWQRTFGLDQARDYALSLNQPPLAAFRMAAGPPAGAVSSDLVPEACIRNGAREDGASGDAEAGAVQFQDEASQLIPWLLNPRAGGRFWDACAAPGGKSSILSKGLGASGWLVASDLSRERARRLAKVLQDAGFADPCVLVADAGQAPPFRGCMDAVLADVPCSGLGTLRRNPEIKWHFRPEEFEALARTQKRILACASEAVRPGGRLLYSTCSTEPEENEQVIASFLAEHADFRLEIPVYPPGIERWTGSDGMVRTFPTTRLWDGFFAALLRRRS